MATTTQRAEAKDLGATVQEAINGKSVHVHVGTWLDRPGVSIDVRLQSSHTGNRVTVHKWADEAICTVRYITGDFWRDPDNAREYGKSEDVPYTADGIVAAAQALTA